MASSIAACLNTIQKGNSEMTTIIDKLRLDGKKIYITGGAQGLGKSMAQALAEAGADVAIVDIQLEKAQATAAEIAAATGQKVIAVKADVTNPEDVQKMITTWLIN